jgi:hypothetical protein
MNSMELSVQVDLTKIVIMSALLFSLIVWRLRDSKDLIVAWRRVGHLLEMGFRSRKFEKLRRYITLVVLLRAFIIGVIIVIMYDLYSYFNMIEYLTNPHLSVDWHLKSSIWADAEITVGKIVERSFYVLLLVVVDASVAWGWEAREGMGYKKELDDKSLDIHTLPEEWSTSPAALWESRFRRMDSYSEDWLESWPEWIRHVNWYRRSRNTN